MSFKKHYTKTELPYNVWIDLDGVLVNLNKAIKVFGMGGFEEVDAAGKSDELFQKVADEGSEFWRHCPWMSDGKELWNYVKKYNPSVLTATPDTGEYEAAKGKKLWVKEQLGPFVECITTKKNLKQKYANKYSILVDDFKKNIDQWIEAGGIGILHTSTKNTIEELKKLGI